MCPVTVTAATPGPLVTPEPDSMAPSSVSCQDPWVEEREREREGVEDIYWDTAMYNIDKNAPGKSLFHQNSDPIPTKVPVLSDLAIICI